MKRILCRTTLRRRNIDELDTDLLTTLEENPTSVGGGCPAKSDGRRLTMMRALRIAAAAACCLSIVGCATLPDTDPLTERHAAQAARFEGALGQLSEKRSAAIVANLKRKPGGLDILDKQLSL